MLFFLPEVLQNGTEELSRRAGKLRYLEFVADRFACGGHQFDSRVAAKL